jgi:hypothetical protein
MKPQRKQAEPMAKLRAKLDSRNNGSFTWQLHVALKTSNSERLVDWGNLEGESQPGTLVNRYLELLAKFTELMGAETPTQAYELLLAQRISHLSQPQVVYQVVNGPTPVPAPVPTPVPVSQPQVVYTEPELPKPAKPPQAKPKSSKSAAEEAFDLLLE